MNPNHIGQSLQPVAVPGHFAFVLRIDPFEIPETLREVFHPVVDLLFGEDPDTVRSGLFVESLAVGVVVRVSEERPIATELVIGFRIGVFADEKQDTVPAETRRKILRWLALNYRLYEYLPSEAEIRGRFISRKPFPAEALRRQIGKLRNDRTLFLRIVSADLYTLYVEGNVYLRGAWHRIFL